MRTKSKGFTISELLITASLFAVLSLVLFKALQEVSRVYYRSSSRDEAVGQVLKAKARLLRDLANSSQQSGQFAVAKVPAHLGSGFDGDALTFLSSDDGTVAGNFTTDPASGQAIMASQITYYLIIPSASNKYGVYSTAGAADAAGYEQQCPIKWLVRRVDPVGAGPAPVINPAWTGWMSTAPTAMGNSPTQQVVAELQQFRVLQQAPLWTLQISALAISDAQRQVAVGSIPLTGSPFVVSEQFSMAAGN